MHVFDLGNTRAHAGAYRNGRLSGARALEYAELFKLALTGPVVYASVNAPMNARFERRFRAKRMGRDFQAAIRNRTRRPAGVGADRLANAVAAWTRAGRACVAVDIGTALTIDVVNRRGEFLGGLIAPGPTLQARSLHEHTALLPEVRVRPAVRAVGRETVEAINAGVYLGIVGLLREGLGRVRSALGVRPRIFGTGGAAALFSEHFDEIVPGLTLEGIGISAEQAGIA